MTPDTRPLFDAPRQGYTICTTCIRCDAEGTFSVTDGYHRWLGGLPARHVFPLLSRPAARFIDTGICPACQDEEMVR